MKKLILMLAVAFVISGCTKKEKGDKGDRGAAAGQFQTISGNVVSNDQTIFVPMLDASSNMVTVYLLDSSAAAELPYFLPAAGVNAFYVAGIGSVRIFNAQLAGALTYSIVVINPVSSAGLSGLSRLE